MSIPFVPNAGTVLMCDFSGFVPPEMTKVRHVVVISPRSRRTNLQNGTCLVVPFRAITYLTHLLGRADDGTCITSRYSSEMSPLTWLPS